MYDAIVVGGRVAGSSTAMLLARKGMKVLVVDRASFPSDTLSTHQVQVPGVARLREWGLLDKVIASGAPPARHVVFDQGPAVLDGHFPEFEGVDAVYSPRRTVLDAILLDAAREAGAEFREDVIVEELTTADGRVTGIRGARKGGPTVLEWASVVIGADGKHSMVAARAGSAPYKQTPSLTGAFYTYWEGVSLRGGELYGRPGRAFGAWPTNDGLTITFASWPVDEFDDFRSDVEGNFLRTADLAGDLGERLRSGRRVERFRGTRDLPNAIRTPYGPGWALVGDAGLVMDPITGQGIGHAFADAELVSDALEAGLGGSRPLDEAMAEYQSVRDRDRMPMYETTLDIASFARSPEEGAILFGAVAKSQEHTDQFLGVITGAVSPDVFFAPRNLLCVLGVRGVAKMARLRMRASRGRERRPEPIPA
jgi:2-polyprenyl-6-methoxyphenol hydroxylase-like FAD-dependent oxidoreductase